ncbi:MAG: tryptophan synthase subunit alpha [Ginsengibacter sp.]|nr:tryptophan synthase subunit alpha [Hanamia sp.]
MNALQKLLSSKSQNLLSIYFTAGFPELNNTATVISALQKHGADMIEIGMPYSDPLADGPVIQQSSMRALQNGMSIKLLIDQLRDFENSKKEGNEFPLILMGYLNPVLQYGFEKFCSDAKSSGISAIILPDLPIAEYESHYKPILEKNGLSFIFLITPETSEERIRKIDSLSNAFIYAVSSSSITGKNTDMNAQENYFRRLKEMHLKNKILIGFGIRDHQTFEAACKHASGAIIGTAYIKALENSNDIEETTSKFLNSILQS